MTALEKLALETVKENLDILGPDLYSQNWLRELDQIDDATRNKISKAFEKRVSELRRRVDTSRQFIDAILNK